MEAFVSGLVIRDENPNLIVKCENGKIVSVDYNDTFCLPKLTGHKVEVKGNTFFNNGEIMVYATEIAVLKKKRPYIKIYKPS